MIYFNSSKSEATAHKTEPACRSAPTMCPVPRNVELQRGSAILVAQSIWSNAERGPDRSQIGAWPVWPIEDGGGT